MRSFSEILFLYQIRIGKVTDINTAKSQNQTADIAIVGAGPAGMTAAIYGARANRRILLFEKLVPGGQMTGTNEIQNYPGLGTVSGAELSSQMFSHVQSLDKVTVLYETVTGLRDIDPLHKEILCAGKVYHAKTVILAPGAHYRKLGVLGEGQFAGNGVSWCAVCDGEQYRGKRVAVVGGGNSAVEEALFLAGIVQSLTLVTMLGLTADASSCVRLRACPNVQVYLYQDVDEILGDGRVEGIRFHPNGKGPDNQDRAETVLPCDGVFVYIGMTPSTAFLENTGLLENGYLVTDTHQQTRLPGIFGAGDCCAKDLRQIITACSDGAEAAVQASHFLQAHAKQESSFESEKKTQ